MDYWQVDMTCDKAMRRIPCVTFLLPWISICHLFRLVPLYLALVEYYIDLVMQIHI